MAIIGVSIYSIEPGGYKVFDSHARDMYHDSHGEGTCVLLEIPSMHKLVQYFQTLHRNEDIQLFQKTLSGEKQKVFKPRPQGHVGCFESVFCWPTITPLIWSLIFIRHLY